MASESVEAPEAAEERGPAPARFLIFFSVAISIVGLLHWYIGDRLIAGAALGAPWSTLAWGVFGLLFVSIPLRFVFRRSSVSGPLQAFFWLSYLWFGAIGLFATAALLTDVVRWTAEIVYGVPDAMHRLAWGRAQALAIAATALPAMVYGFRTARGAPRVERVSVPIRNLPAAFEGFRIAQLSDVHIGETLGRAFLEGIVAQVNALGADMIAITGDLIDGSVSELREEVAPLSKLRARDGVFFVTGNHEYYHGGRAWEAEVQRTGATVLHNEHRVLRRGDDALVVAGVTDLQGGSFHPDDACRPDLALAGAPDAPRILLAHQPRAAALAKDLGVALQLSGHTHGGQIFPFMFFVRLQQPMVSGLKKLFGIWVYTSRGTGYWGPPMRVGAPPEISEISLRRA